MIAPSIFCPLQFEEGVNQNKCDFMEKLVTMRPARKQVVINAYLEADEF